MGAQIEGITELKITNCPAVETLFVSDNQITKIEGLTDLSKLKKLSFGGNKLEEIDISKNTELEMLYFRDNPATLKFANGIKNLSKLIKELKEIAKELGLDGEGKSLDEIKQAIKDELDKNKQNKEKLDQELPGLFGADGKVDESKLGEIKDKAEKGNNYNDLVEKNPDLIVDGKIDQGKLSDLNDKGKKFDDLKNTMDAIGIDPNNVADATKNIKELKALEESVIAYFGKDYKERLRVETYQAYIEDKSIKKIELYDENRKAKVMEELTGELVIKDYTELEEIDFQRWDKKVKDKITKVTIENCPKVKNINFDNSETTEIIFQGSFPNLARLDLPNNKLIKIDVSKLPNLTNLNIARNPNLTEITDDLKKRPTQEDLNKAVKDAEDKAVKNTEDKFKDYINPNDPAQKDKLEAAAKNQVANDLQSRPNTGSSGTGATLTTEQQQKLNDYDKVWLTSANTTRIIRATKIKKIDDSKKSAPTDKLTGKGVIEGYPDLEEINLKGNNEIEELIIRNCPKLKKIDVNENKKLKILKFDDMVPNGDNQLEFLACINCEEIEKLSLKTCKHLKTLNVNNCKKLDAIKGIEDVDSIDELKAKGVPKIKFIHSDKLDGFIESKNALKELLGLSPNDKLPDSVRNNGKIDKDKLKNELTGKVAGSANNEKNQAKQEAKTAKTEKTNLENQLNAIKTELGLGNVANQQQIIAKIKELMGRPAITDYNAIKAERDNLKSERDTLKTENTRLKNDNKENVNPNALRENTKTNLEK
ncbi:997_t:CDS:2 [Cetraspora pellucida]|uniref:997_t:CDS:1 n=1 Tax=Cetraspora pellucida TaxID=1433469 RepID=A0ACA9MIC5_9GLOM|nr:997_t:CDS:2 [Cetraspora pellucida]